MLRLQTSKPVKGSNFDDEELIDDQSIKATTKRIVADAKVTFDLSNNWNF